MNHRLGFALLCCCFPLPAQTTWVVDAGRQPGWQFTTLTAAFAAAAPGDIVVVRAAATSYAGATITRGLHLLGENAPVIDSELVIRNVPQDEQVALKGLVFRESDNSGRTGGRGIACSDNDGTVHLEDGCFPLAIPQPAILSSNSSLLVKGTGIQGGASSCRQAAGLQADATTRVTHDPSTSFTITGATPNVRPFADLQTDGVAPGKTLTLNLRNTGTANYAIVGSFPFGPVLPGTGLWLDQALAVPLFAGVVQSSRTDRATVPTFFTQGLPAAFQAVLLQGGTLELSTPVVAVLHEG